MKTLNRNEIALTGNSQSMEANNSSIFGHLQVIIVVVSTDSDVCLSIWIKNVSVYRMVMYDIRREALECSQLN
jgi:hypothetical protein